MTPRLERARLILRSGLASYRGYLVVRNVVANLAQGVEVGSCWFDFFVFHACPLTGSKNQANTFSLFCGMVVKSFSNTYEGKKTRAIQIAINIDRERWVRRMLDSQASEWKRKEYR